MIRLITDWIFLTDSFLRCWGSSTSIVADSSIVPWWDNGKYKFSLESEWFEDNLVVSLRQSIPPRLTERSHRSDWSDLNVPLSTPNSLEVVAWHSNSLLIIFELLVAESASPTVSLDVNFLIAFAIRLRLALDVVDSDCSVLFIFGRFILRPPILKHRDNASAITFVRPGTWITWKSNSCNLNFHRIIFGEVAMSI